MNPDTTHSSTSYAPPKQAHLVRLGPDAEGKFKRPLEPAWPENPAPHDAVEPDKAGLVAESMDSICIDVDDGGAACRDRVLEALGAPWLLLESSPGRYHLWYRVTKSDKPSVPFNARKVGTADHTEVEFRYGNGCQTRIADWLKFWRAWHEVGADAKPLRWYQVLDLLEAEQQRFTRSQSPAPRRAKQADPDTDTWPEGTRDTALYNASIEHADEPKMLQRLAEKGLRSGLPDEQVQKVQASAAKSEKAQRMRERDRNTPVAYARALADELADKVRYVAGAGYWLRWTGDRWKPDRSGATSHEVHQWCADRAKSTGYKRKEAYWRRFGRDVLAYLAETPALVVVPEDLDTHRDKLGVPGGVVDLRSGALVKAQPEWLMTKQATVAPASSGKPKHFTKFLHDIAPEGDKTEWCMCLRNYLGYCITGSITDHRCQFWHGGGTNGKSKLFEACVRLLGDDYSAVAETRMLEIRRNEGHSTEVTPTIGRRLVVVSEVKATRMNVALLKTLTGDDRVAGRFMRQDSTSWPRTAKLLLVGNDEPALGRIDAALRRRIRKVPFVQDFTDRMDDAIAEKLAEDAPFILAWLIAGAVAFYAAGNCGRDPQIVETATEQYFEREDVVRAWLAERITRDADAQVIGKELKASFDDWCDDQGITAQYKRNEVYAAILAMFGMRPERLTRGEHRMKSGFAGLKIRDV